MLLVLAGSILTFTMVQEATVVEPFEKGQIVIEQDVDSSPIELRPTSGSSRWLSRNSGISCVRPMTTAAEAQR